MEHDLPWLQAQYGSGLHVVAADPPCWKLKYIIIDTSGETNLKMWVHDFDGMPKAGVATTYAYPSLESPNEDLPDIPLAFITRGGGKGVQNKNVAGGDGLVSFQIGSQSWIKNGVGPYQAWVLSTQLPSDIFVGAGWLGGTNHHGPVQFVFQQVSADVVNPPSADALPENEPIMSVGILADKCRWWLEKYTRCIEEDNAEYDPIYGKAILYSLIKLSGGLFYRLENALKSGATSG